MKNEAFEIQIDENTGYITEIRNTGDPHGMNWCSSLSQWGRINVTNRIRSEYHDRLFEDLKVEEVTVSDTASRSVYANNRYRITLERQFRENGNLQETCTVHNITDTVLCLNRDNFSIAFPLNDTYTYADDCMVNRCNTHIWCGWNCAWINALKMGDSPINLGVYFTEGSIVSYSQYGCETNVRGWFELEPETVLLKKGDSYVLSWELFWHEGKKDFLKKLSGFDGYIGIEAEHYTVFEGENIAFRISVNGGEAPVVSCDGEEIPCVRKPEGYSVSHIPARLGEHLFRIRCGRKETCAQFLAKPAVSGLMEKRVHYIVNRQQCLDRESPLYGAYLVFDNKLEAPFFDYFNTDHNACRERMNMPLAIIRYLQQNRDEKVRQSLDLYMEFLYREFFEEKTGEVFNNIGKSRDALRLYNAPGVMLIFTEMYRLTGNERYLDSILMLARKYYSIGGEKCYSNAVSIKLTVQAFRDAGRDADAQTILEFFRRHTDNMLSNGLSYPIHEVNYEQTIVTPTVSYISQFGQLVEDRERYLAHAKMHMECLDRFMGNQPSFHLNEISIRYWDAFWFGKGKRFGDTLPQHLSCLSARAFISYAELTGDREYLRRAEECIRNCFCLISDNGQGSAAYVYPNYVNGCPGEYYDGWANDQDLVIYDALMMRAVYGNF